MSDFFPLVTAIIISVALSSGTVFAIYRPLHQLLEAVCPLGLTANFWTRAAVTVIYLLPLWVVLVFGLPDMQRVDYVSGGEIARRALAAASFALVGIVVATGWRLAGVRAPSSNAESHYDRAVR